MSNLTLLSSSDVRTTNPILYGNQGIDSTFYYKDKSCKEKKIEVNIRTRNYGAELFIFIDGKPKKFKLK